jgi:hypothetical protein
MTPSEIEPSDLQRSASTNCATKYDEKMNRNSEKIKQRETTVRVKENKEAKKLRREFIV